MVLQSTLFACLLNGATMHIVRMSICLRAGCSASKRDAIPRFFPGSAPEHATYEPASAPEPAAYECLRPGAAGIFSWDRAKHVPQGERLSKEYIWQAVQRIPDVQSRAGLDITCGQHIMLWLWICSWAIARGLSSGMAFVLRI